MPSKFAIIAVIACPFAMRVTQALARWREAVLAEWEGERARAERFRQARHLPPGDFKDPATYSKFGEEVRATDQEWKVKAGHIFLATPPVMIGVIPRCWADAGLNRNRARDRIVVESDRL